MTEHRIDRAPVSEQDAAWGAAIVAGASDAIMGLDLLGVIRSWNAGCEELYGWSADEMLGRTPDVLIPEARREEVLRMLRALVGAREAAALETERLHKSGEIRPVSCRVSPMLGPSGEVIGASAVVRDNSREVQLRRQLEQARHVAEARFAQSVVAQATLSPAGTILEVNDALCRLSGYASKDLLGRPATGFVAAADVERATLELARLAGGGPSGSRIPQCLLRADGRRVETRLSVFPVRDTVTGAVLRLEAVVEDVSATVAAERELQLREARWQSMAQHSSDVALFCDVDAVPLHVSCAVTAVFGYPPEQLLGVDGWSYVHPEDLAGVQALWGAVAAAGLGTTQTFEARLRHADGSWRWTEESLTNHLDDPAVAAMVVNLVDISERKAAEAVLDELAGTDTLTGLATRAPLMAALDAAFAAGLAASTAVVVLDIARMKLVNDTHGHRVGDEVLAEVGARLRLADPQAVLARLGGDRFAVVLHDVTDVVDVFEAAAALLALVEAPMQLGPMTVSLSAAVGGALGPALESDALLASAESAMLTAKEGLAGPLHVVRAESASAALSRARVVEDLQRGLERDELVVHFQPVVSLGDGLLVAAEALVRWQHPDKGLLGPGAFLDAAEDSGLIVTVGERVLQEACRAAARWAHVRGSGGRPFHVAVNLSARQLTRGGVVDVVRSALAESGAQAAHLMLEVTESAVMSDVDAAVQTLRELRDLGVGIALDDFGTGYSSLTYLKRFPVTTLKIDRSFVSGLGTNDADAAIVTSVINLARAMDLDCIAEGVETEQQRLVLQALGCTKAQGFLWSPALDAATFETWLGPGGGGRGGRASRKATAPPAPGLLGRMRELKASGASLTTIAAALNADQQLTAVGRRWTARSVADLLSAAPPAPARTQ